MTAKHVALGFGLSLAAALGCGSSGGGGGNDGGGSGGSGGNMCAPNTGTSCTQAEINTYNTCVQNACNSEFVTCYGPSYKSGTFSGVCASYMQCQNACACTDTACRSACVIPAGCTSCLTAIGTCSVGSGCTIPACLSGGGFDGGIPGLDGGFPGLDGGLPGFDGSLPFDAGNFTCADLTACCNAITDAQQKQGCQAVVTVNNNQICSATLGTYKMGGICP
jgi:hypothetical protein